MATNILKNLLKKFGELNTIIISADIENQINQLNNEEKINYMKMINLKTTGLNMLINKGYNILEIRHFLYIWTRRIKSLDHTKKLYSFKGCRYYSF